MQCDFCHAKHLPVTKYKCIGINCGKKAKKTIKMCIVCNAYSDESWLAFQLDWDGITEMIAQGRQIS